MLKAKTIVVVLVTLCIGFAGGFGLRPMIAPTQQARTIAAAPPATPVSSEARGTQYFVKHINEARRVVAGCSVGSVRGGECATAEDAIIKVEARERRKRFLGN